MFSNRSKIVIVDDNESDLITLAKAFLTNGLACKIIEYTEFYNEEPLTGIRLAFFDINLTNRGADFDLEEYDYKNDRNLSSTFNDLAVAINKIIGANNGPYVLIFWSLRTQCINNFKEYINDPERGYSNTPKPISILSLEKEELLDKTPQELADIIDTLLDAQSIQILYDFESKCEKAATKTINEIYKITPKNHNIPWGDMDDEFEGNFKNIFSKIAISGVGKEMANKEPDKAIYKTLMPLIEYQITQLLPDSKWKSFLGNNLLNSSYPQDFNVAQLNSIFHVDLETDIFKHHRGAVFEYELITEDEKRKFNAHLSSYYKSLEQKSNDLFNCFIRFDDEFTCKSDFKFGSKFVLIEISAACDFSNAKQRNLKYVLGLLTPVPVDLSCVKKANEAVLYKEIPVLYIDGKKQMLWINLNHTFSNLTVNYNIGKPLFVLKKELVDLIGNRYANHISRIGITSF